MTPVCVFAKAPEPGQVKTRLGLPGERAVALHRAFVADTLHAVARAGLPATLAVGGDPGSFRVDVPTERQVEGDLGARMGHVLRTAPGPAIIVGTDAPTLPPRLLQAAADALKEHPVVFAPANDGGYVLVGAREGARFEGVRWSTEHALADSLRANPGARLLEPWYDVDTPADLDILRAHLALDGSAAPTTANLLRTLRGL